MEMQIISVYKNQTTISTGKEIDAEKAFNKHQFMIKKKKKHLGTKRNFLQVDNVDKILVTSFLMVKD